MALLRRTFMDLKFKAFVTAILAFSVNAHAAEAVSGGQTPSASSTTQGQLDLNDGIYSSSSKGCDTRISHDPNAGKLLAADVSTPGLSCAKQGGKIDLSRTQYNKFEQTKSLTVSANSKLPKSQYPWLYNSRGAYLPHDGDSLVGRYQVTVNGPHKYELIVKETLERNGQVIAGAPDQISNFGPINHSAKAPRSKASAQSRVISYGGESFRCPPGYYCPWQSNNGCPSGYYCP
jgi:hypothetical protein